jgi:hypothetical protein
MPMQSTRIKGNAQEEASRGGVTKILSPGSRQLSLRLPKRIATTIPTREESTKSLHPQGTLPMKESGTKEENDNNKEGMSKDNMSSNLDSLVESDQRSCLPMRRAQTPIVLQTKLQHSKHSYLKEARRVLHARDMKMDAIQQQKMRVKRVTGRQSHGCLLQKEEAPKQMYQCKGNICGRNPFQ